MRTTILGHGGPEVRVIELDATLIDTADVYRASTNEELVGRALTGGFRCTSSAPGWALSGSPACWYRRCFRSGPWNAVRCTRSSRGRS